MKKPLPLLTFLALAAVVLVFSKLSVEHRTTELINQIKYQDEKYSSIRIENKHSTSGQAVRCI